MGKEDRFVHLLSRWRHTQVYLDRDYEWLMPPCEQHMFSEGAQQIYPLFVIFEETLPRIQRGLAGAGLPFVIQTPQLGKVEQKTEVVSTEG